jgi:chorismate mutase
MRREVTRIDQKILRLLAERQTICAKIGRQKKKYNRPIRDQKRWGQLLQKNRRTAARLGLSPKFVANLWTAIHSESLRLQRRVK